MNYIEILFEDINTEMSELLVAQLANINFEGFEESENQLKAYISAEEYNELITFNLLEKFKCKFSISNVPGQNWNALWESNFEPVIVDDFCEVRADFHTPSNSTLHEIIITPKMSFGTGHHATTYMMIQQMRNIEFENMSVADFGTGTAILAILAEKLGSKKVIAIDYDEWSIRNAEENILRNDCSKIQLEQSDKFSPPERSDIILANINKNVILDNLNGLVFGLNKNGLLLISGFLKEDENELIEKFTNHRLLHVITFQSGNWISVLLKS
jgi:ribosomal protein L11 methyltransferase